MVKSHAVELFERVRNLPVRGGESRIHGDSFHFRGCRGAANIDATTLFDIAEIAGVNTTPLVRDHRWLHVTDECPLRLAEKRMSLDVRSPSSSSKAFCFILDQKFADQRLAEAVWRVSLRSHFESFAE